MATLTNDIALYNIECGEGPVLILLHGNGEDHSYFDYQIQPFASCFRVIAIDTRGHGLSPRGEKPFRIEQFADDLLSFMDVHGIGKASLFGFSDGGNIALRFALKYPERVESLVISGANLYPAGVKTKIQLQIDFWYGIHSLLSAFSSASKKKAELLGLMVNDPNISENDLHRIDAPTLVIAGTDDMIKDDHTRRIAQNIKGSRLEIIPGTHFVVRENHEVANRVVMDFFKSIGLC